MNCKIVLMTYISGSYIPLCNYTHLCAVTSSRLQFIEFFYFICCHFFNHQHKIVIIVYEMH